MSEFTLQLTNKAHSDLVNLPVKNQVQVAKDIKTLNVNPFPDGSRIKKLKGFAFSLYRLRSGDFRVLYRIDGNLITLMRVIDRKMLNRILATLK